MIVDTKNLVGVADIAERAGVGDPAVSNWQTRYDTFPKPVTTISRGTRIWLWSDVHAWLVETGRL